jgi:hypothetical protein
MQSRISFTFLSTLFFSIICNKTQQQQNATKEKIFYDLIQAMQNDETLDKKQISKTGLAKSVQNRKIFHNC